MLTTGGHLSVAEVREIFYFIWVGIYMIVHLLNFTELFNNMGDCKVYIYTCKISFWTNWEK